VGDIKFPPFFAQHCTPYKFMAERSIWEKWMQKAERPKSFMCRETGMRILEIRFLRKHGARMK